MLIPSFGKEIPRLIVYINNVYINPYTSEFPFNLTKTLPWSVSKLCPSFMQPPLVKPKAWHLVVFSSFFKISSSFLEAEAFAMLETTIIMVSAFNIAHADDWLAGIVNFEKWRVPS